MKRNVIMGLAALACIFLSIPTLLLILSIYGHGFVPYIFCVLLALLVGGLGANLASLAFEYIDHRKNKKAKSLHGRRRAGRV